MKVTVLHNATIVTASKEAIGSVIIRNGMIEEVIYQETNDLDELVRKHIGSYDEAEIIDLTGRHLMAGGIDAHVHFRDPGLTHKADIETESRAAAAGGVTSVIDMPNTSPATTSAETLMSKLESASNRSYVNIGFHIGATNSNASQIKNLLEDRTNVPSQRTGGIKVFMGSSTGNMLVDNDDSLDEFFKLKKRPVLVHCEDEKTIKDNLAAAIEKYGEEIPFEQHENIRSRKACIRSSIKALEKAIKYGTRMVLCHISTSEELEMVRAAKISNPEIIAETSCNYLWFSNEDYSRLGSLAKCNPSIKRPEDRSALRDALANGIIDTIGSDHAPHLLSEKDKPYTSAPSGLPSIQQSLPVLLTIASQEDIPLTRIAAVFSENASDLYGIRRGKIKAGYAADIVVFDKDREFTVIREEQLGKCRWSPYEGETLKGYIETVFVNGKAVICNGRITEDKAGQGELLSFR